MGIGLGDLSEEELSGVIESVVFGLVGTGGGLLNVFKGGKEEGTLVDFPFFRVLSLVFGEELIWIQASLVYFGG